MIDEVEGRGTLDVSKEREQAEKIKENRSRNHG